MRAVRTWLVMLLLSLPVALVASPAGGHVFGWPLLDQDMSPRGGTTRGPMPQLKSEPTAGWQALQEPDLSALERDRRAILAMAGEYRVSFDFMEIEGYSHDYRPAQPYHSWATEIIEVLAADAHFISLQHVLVMHFESEDGDVSEPQTMVTKHWRQDWHYQDCAPFRYLGFSSWAADDCDTMADGEWVQAVYHVDDSPRYTATGHWQHAPGRSTWSSKATWRPLPQREFTVRDDYDVLIGSNRQTLTPNGWVHEQHNLKAVLAETGQLDPEQPYLAKEIGLNRYEPVTDYPFDPGHEYLDQTAGFWHEVRAAWHELLEQAELFELAEETDAGRLFMRLFRLAQAVDDDARAQRAAIDLLLAEHVQVHEQD